jgi:transcriptional regulator with XRE-family HTH domain
MREATRGSTVPRRQLGRHLREARGRARLTVRAAAKALEWSEAKMWRIESGQSPMRVLDVESMCRVYGAPEDLTKALMELAKETKERGWWHAHSDVMPAWFSVYVGLEEAARSLWIYHPELVPGLFQTAEYAREIISTDNPGASPEEIEGRVQLRMARQSLLTRVTDPPAITVVLNEAVLRRAVGGPAVMARQCTRLIGLSELPTVALHVLPFSAGLHHGAMTSLFTLLRFPPAVTGEDTEPPTVYVEGHTGALYLDQPHEVERYVMAVDRIMDKIDASGAVTRRLLEHAVKEHSP